MKYAFLRFFGMIGFLGITAAFAQAPAPALPTAGGGMSDTLMQPMPFLLIFVIMWFLLIRPQQKRMREHREMVKALRRDDVVVTGGGFVGKVTKIIDDNEVEVEIAPNVRVKVVRATLTDIRSKPQPIAVNDK
jgi:preprotein translocase subunit YajC